MKVRNPFFWASCTAACNSRVQLSYCPGPLTLVSSQRVEESPRAWQISFFWMIHWLLKRKVDRWSTPSYSEVILIWLLLGDIGYFIQWWKTSTNHLGTGHSCRLAIWDAGLLTSHSSPIVSLEYRCRNSRMSYLVLSSFHFQFIFMVYILFGIFFRIKSLHVFQRVKIRTNIKPFLHLKNFCFKILLSLKVRLMTPNDQGKILGRKWRKRKLHD